jgi:hypothetical protein
MISNCFREIQEEWVFMKQEQQSVHGIKTFTKRAKGSSENFWNVT